MSNARLLEKVLKGSWLVEIYSDGTAVLRARYWNRPNYIYSATWDREQETALFHPYDSEYQPQYLFKAVNALFQRNLSKIGDKHA